MKPKNQSRFQVFIGLTSSFESCFKALYDKDFEAFLVKFILQPQIIRDHRDKF